MSQRFTVDPDQQKAIIKSLKKYTLPLVLLFLVQVQQGTKLQDALWLVYGAGLQLAINFLSKWIAEE